VVRENGKNRAASEKASEESERVLTHPMKIALILRICELRNIGIVKKDELVNVVANKSTRLANAHSNTLKSRASLDVVETKAQDSPSHIHTH
jgi:hypothetical protein